MPIKLANNASGTLATAINASDTGIALTTGDGAEFPVLGAGDYFYATLTSTQGTQEIVKATARSGDSLTVVRAQEGTSAAGFAAGTRFELRVTAQSIEDLVDDYDDALRADLAASSGTSLVGFIQAGTGATARTLQAKARDVVNVKDFGAVGDGVADDTAAIQAAADYCAANNKTLVGEGSFVISSTISISCNCALGDASFYVPATTVSPAVRFGPNLNVAIDCKIAELPKVYNSSKTGAGWAGFASAVGIDIANVLSSQITVPRVQGFGIGIDVGGYETGNAFNNIFIGWIVNCKTGLKLSNKGIAGYSNSNTFYGGDIFMSSSEGVSIITGSYGVHCDQTTNNNTFVNVSLEANQNQYQIYLHDSAFNKFITPRLEISGGGRIAFNSSFSEGCQGNIFDNGYSQDTRQFTYINQPSKYNESYDKASKYFDFSPEGIAIRNGGGNGPTRPHITGYASGTVNFLNKLPSTGTDWTYKLYGDGISFKDTAYSFATISVAASGGYIYFGRGAAAATDYLRAAGAAGAGIMSGAHFVPDATGTRTLGRTGGRWSATYTDAVRVASAEVLWTSGSGTPEGAVTAPVGSLYTRTNGGAGTTLYVKESGSGNTGWVAK